MAFTWAWTFNLLNEYKFSRETLTTSVQDGARTGTLKAPARETIGRDVDCLLHTYTGEGLSQLTKTLTVL